MKRMTCVLGTALCIAATAGCGNPPETLEQVHEGLVTTEDGVELHYEMRGSGPDTLIVLHGGPGLSSAYLVPDLAVLSDDYTVIFYDQRGAGRSTVITDSTRLRLADHVGDLEAVRRHFGLERATVLGHSWGAGLAAFYAQAHPDRVAHLILVDAIPARMTPWMQEFGQNLTAWMDSATASEFATLAQARREASDPVAACRAYWTLFIRGYLSDPLDERLPARMRGDVCDAPPEAILNGGLVNASVLGPMGDWDWRNEFGQVRAPVLIIHGEQDPIPAASVADWEEALPGATLVFIEGSGHFPFVEQPEAFVRAIDAFVR
jgi:proline iminopeptidase